MRNWNSTVLGLALLAGLLTAWWILTTHEPKLSPAVASGLLPAPRELGYRADDRPTVPDQLERAVRGLRRTDFVAWNWLGEVRSRSGNPEGAAEAWRRAMELAREATENEAIPSYAWLHWYSLGWAAAKLGEETEAKQAMAVARTRLERNIQRNPRSAEIHRHLGWALHHLGQPDEAADAWARAARIMETGGPGSPSWPFWLRLAGFRALAGDTHSALEALAAAVEGGGEDFDHHLAAWTPDLDPIRDHPDFPAALSGQRPEAP
jgi:tetratricopeptide (TPR) repeat protein